MNSRRRGDPSDADYHIHRRRTDAEAVLRLHTRVDDCERNIRALLEMEQARAMQFEAMNINVARVAEVLEAWTNAKGFVATVGFASGFARIVFPIAALAVALWVFAKTGNWKGD